MDVIVDGNQDFQLTGDPPDVFSVIVAVDAFLQENDRAIQSVKIDGKPVTPEGTEALRGMPLSDVAMFEVESEEIQKLVAECLDELEQELPNLPGACHELAAQFQGESPEDGFAPCDELAKAWGYVKTQEQLVINALGLDPGAVEIEGVSLETLHTDLNGRLEEAIQALQASDTVLLGDLLEYELAQRAERETQIVGLLRDKARERFG